MVVLLFSIGRAALASLWQGVEREGAESTRLAEEGQKTAGTGLGTRFAGSGLRARLNMTHLVPAGERPCCDSSADACDRYRLVAGPGVALPRVCPRWPGAMEVLVLKVIREVAARVVSRDDVPEATERDGYAVITIAYQCVLTYEGLVARPAATGLLQVAGPAAAKVDAGTMAGGYDVVQYAGAFAGLVPDAVPTAPVDLVDADADAGA